MRLLRSARAGIAAMCVSTLVAAPLLVPTTSTAAPPDETPVRTISIKVSGKAVTVSGARGLHAGRVEVKVSGRGVAEIVRFQRGYDLAKLMRDIRLSDQAGNMNALRRAIARTTFLGGFEPGGGGTVVLPRAGDYTVFSFSSRGHADFTAAARRQTRAPVADGRIVARTGPTWGGSSQLPARGTFTFKNADSTVPHFVVLSQVAEGTTTDQVLTSLNSQEPPPDFFLGAGLETASISPGHTMTVDYDLPPGQYVVMCFFPDPSMGGMAHALMGMLKMIHLG